MSFTPRRAIAQRLLCALALLCVAGSPSGAQALDEDTWVVAIGNNVGARGEATLLYAQRDAREVSDALRLYGGVGGHRVTLLFDEDVSTVRRALLEVNTAIRARSESGRRTTLLVFYSGHADAGALHLGSSKLEMDEIRALVESSPAKVRLLVVDACRSGTVTRVKGVKAGEAFAVTMDNGSMEGMAIITSSASGEASQESDTLQASFFSHHFVNALRGAADRNGDGRVTLSEAYAYTYTQTLRSSGRTLALQHPTYSFDVKGRGELVLSTPGEQSGGRVRLSKAGTYLISERGRNGEVVAELETLRDGALIALPAGAYLVQHRRADEYREYEIEVGRDGEANLASANYASLRYDRLVRERGAGSGAVHGFNLLLGARGGLLEGEGAAPQMVLGYGVDLPWFSIGGRLRGSRVNTEASGLTRTHGELGGGLLIQRFVDVSWASFAFGIWLEGAWHRQRLESTAGSDRTDTRDSGSFSVGALAAFERSLGHGLSLRLEGGPLTTQIQLAQTSGGAQTGSGADTRLTWWATGGLAWRL